MNIELNLQVATQSKMLPTVLQLEKWVKTTFENRREAKSGEITIRIVDEEESATLNEQYRGKKGPTNVLSFHYDTLPGMTESFLGDLVICAPVVEKEAEEQHKTLLAHWAHMVIHGSLHLLGFDHVMPLDAENMEGLETELMVKLGFPSPYGDIIQS